jgi:perosamine synthetase
MKIPWAKPTIFGNEVQFLTQAVESTWLSDGEFVGRLEKDIAEQFFCNNAIVVSNGTAALDLAYRMVGLGPGDEVIVPGFGFMAAANVAIHQGASPVYADVDENTWCVTANTIDKCISDRTKLIVPIHTYGNVCQMYDIMDLARARGIAVIEDGSEAFGSKIKNQHAGTFGDLATFSFHATKTITTGEGGVILTNDSELAEKLRTYRSHGLLRKKHYWHEVPGHNFRMTNLQAAFGCAQLIHFDQIVVERKRVYNKYKECIASKSGIQLQHYESIVDPVVWTFAIKLNPTRQDISRDCVAAKMKEMGIETRPGFYTPFQMKHIYFSKRNPISEEVSNNVLSLPTYAALSDMEIEYISKTLTSILDRH